MNAPVAALIGLAAFFLAVAAGLAAIEAALPRVGRARVRELVDTDRRNAKALAVIAGDSAAAVTVSTLVRVTAEVIATVAITCALITVTVAWWQAFVLAALGMTLLLYGATGAAPRAVGQRFPDTVALLGAVPLRSLTIVFGGAARVLTGVATRLTGGQPTASGPFASEAELRDLLERAEESAVIDRDENIMAQRVLTLGNLSAREVMVPRTDMVTARREMGLLDALDLFLRSGFSRLPVVGADADDVVGVCYIKDVAARLHPHPGIGLATTTGADAVRAGVEQGLVHEVMRPVIFVPETKPADDLLRELQAASVHLAVVIDEYGGVAGLATIEDLLEEIVGPISDEYDQEVPEAEELGVGHWRVSARMHLHSLSELVATTVEDDDVDTVGGLLAKRLGHVPLPGVSAQVDRLRLTADGRDARKNRLLTVTVELTDPASESQLAQERANVPGS